MDRSRSILAPPYSLRTINNFQKVYFYLLPTIPVSVKSIFKKHEEKSRNVVCRYPEGAHLESAQQQALVISVLSLNFWLFL
jgi:hypothetical protein